MKRRLALNALQALVPKGGDKAGGDPSDRGCGDAVTTQTINSIAFLAVALLLGRDFALIASKQIAQC